MIIGTFSIPFGVACVSCYVFYIVVKIWMYSKERLDK